MTLDFLGAITGIFVIVRDGQHALRFTLGRARAVVGPGIHFKIPLLQVFQVRETKHTTLDLEPQVIQLADDLVYEVDCKVVYQIVNLRKAIIEIDDLVQGLKNRVVMAVQRVVSNQDRDTVKRVEEMSEAIREEVEGVEDQWGVRILQFGFSNISPSPATLEITQLELLAREKLRLFDTLKDSGLTEEASVALISGAVVSVTPEEPERDMRRRVALENEALERMTEALEETEAEPEEPLEEPEDGGEEPGRDDPLT